MFGGFVFPLRVAQLKDSGPTRHRGLRAQRLCLCLDSFLLYLPVARSTGLSIVCRVFSRQSEARSRQPDVEFGLNRRVKLRVDMGSTGRQ